MFRKTHAFFSTYQQDNEGDIDNSSRVICNSRNINPLALDGWKRSEHNLHGDNHEEQIYNGWEWWIMTTILGGLLRQGLGWFSSDRHGKETQEF